MKRKLYTAFALAVIFAMAMTSLALAAVWTDKPDYSPGEVVTISGDNSDGAGFLAGETVHVDVLGPNGYSAACDATADDYGAWFCQVTLAGDGSAVGDYSYTATGQASGVSQNGTFTDQMQGAIFTTDNTCTGVNLNIYDAKKDVYLDGGPEGGGPGLPDGDYYVQVTAPGGDVLGTSVGSGNPTPVHVTNGDFDACYQLWAILFKASDGTQGYDYTTNNGEEYKVWVSPDSGFIDQKTDNFKVREEAPPGPAALPYITKDAHGTYDKTFAWTITKDVDKTVVKQIGGTATFNYTITVSHNDGVVSNVEVTGTITVTNPNEDPVSILSITDELSDGTACTVTNGGPQILSSGPTPFVYECDLGDSLPLTDVNNIATVSWPEQTLSDGSLLAAGSADTKTPPVLVSFVENDIDECVSVNDSYAGYLGDVCVGDANPTIFTYSRTIPVPQWDCLSYINIATFTTNDTGAPGSDDQTVTVCGPAKTGALTMGFWQNKNGQGIIKAGASTTAGVCNSGTWLRLYAPFQDLSATATCAQVATYVTNVIKAANASGASMNAMLKAQMLATALDVYFSDPALGGNQIGAPTPIGGVAIDLTKVCKNIGGGCTIFEDVSGAFGGATSMTISQMLAYAASQSNGMWYGNVKAVQELAKDAFDAINNQKVFAP